jgi:NAD(P)-dependent dehydrogenase (short-subunit alcohol dehydrogenase family)
MAQAVSAFGHVDALVNNAAVTLRRAALEVTPQEWDELMAVNLTGTFFMSQRMGRHLIATRRPGCVISLASTHGMVGYAQRSTYGISKAGIIQMTRMLAIEWAEHGIRVNAIAPGTVDTRRGGGHGVLPRERRGGVYHRADTGARRRTHGVLKAEVSKRNEVPSCQRARRGLREACLRAAERQSRCSATGRAGWHRR